MGASVGIGGLIIGIFMLVVFLMAYQSISSQIDTGLEQLDDANEAVPTFAIDDATLWEGAVVSLTIATAGLDYTDGTLSAAGGFSGTYTVNGLGGIDAVVITSHGNYSSPPSITITCSTACATNSGTASVTATLGNFIHANFTNTGVVTASHEDMWVFTNGSNPVTFDTIYTTTSLSENWYTGETLYLQWNNPTAIGEARLSLTVGSMTVGHELE
jgi:hypothetical protein